MRSFAPPIVAAWLALLALAQAPPARAGGFGIPEMGTRRTGMACVVGRPDEPAAVYHNPAGLVLLPGVRLYASLGLSLVDASFRLRPWEHSDEFLDAPVDAEGYYPATSPTRAFGVIPMLVATAELLPDRLFAAASIYVSNGTGSRFDEDDVTRYHLLDGYIVSPLGALTVAYRPVSWLGVGAGLGVMNIRIHGSRHLFPYIDGSDLSGFLGTRSVLTIDGSDWLPTWNAGLLATPLAGLTLGASVIGRADATLEGPVSVTFDDTIALRPFEGTQRTGTLLPWTFMAGANVDVHRTVELGAELRYYLYREYDEQLTTVTGIPLVKEMRTQKNYDDSWQVSGGVRVHGLAAAPGLELLLGGHYDVTPAPPNTLTFDQPTFDHVGLHTGARLAWGRHRLGATYIHYWYEVPTVNDSLTNPPTNIQGQGENNIFTLTFETVLDRRAVVR